MTVLQFYCFSFLSFFFLLFKGFVGSFQMVKLRLGLSA